MARASVPRTKRASKAIDRDKAIPIILAGVASGKALDAVLKDNPDLPSASTFWRWHMEDESLRDNLARARENGVEVHMDEALLIADTPMEGTVVTRKRDRDGNEYDEVRREDMLGHRKLQIETRIKRAQMIAPRKYGPRVDVTSGGDKISRELTPEEKFSRLAAMQAAMSGGTDDEGR